MESRPPLKWLPVRDDHAAVAFLSGYGGGAVAGDLPRVDIQVGPQARLWAGTQAHTRVYRNPEGIRTGQILTGSLEDGAFCAHLPDPVTPQRSSIWSQSSRWTLGNGSTLVVLESHSAGRQGFEPDFSYTRFESHLEASGPDGEPLLWESYASDPGLLPPGSAAVAGPYTRIWNLFICSPNPEAALDALVAELESALEPFAGVREDLALSFGRSRSCTWCARALAASSDALAPLMASLRQVLSHPSRLGTDPLSRRP
jgi:urease accessory protein UreH